MSAQEQMRAMLDELMGTGRDGNYLMWCYPVKYEKVMRGHTLCVVALDCRCSVDQFLEIVTSLAAHQFMNGGLCVNFYPCSTLLLLIFLAYYDYFSGENNKYKVAFDDARVCKSFLLSCCPHDILSSTRMDLGECPKIHDLALRADYDLASKKQDYYYDIDAMEHLQSFIVECDRKVELAKRRLKETQEELSEEANSKAEVIHQLGEQMGTKLAKAEIAGAEGNVEESLKLMAEVEELKKSKAHAENEYRNSMPASSYQQQKLRVCEVCSAYLGIHDNDRRLADHFGGKLHLGFITIRDKLADLKKSVAERRLQREKEREEMRKGRRDRVDDEDEKRPSPSGRTRTRSRSRSRDRRRRSRSRSRRSRSRDRHSRKRSRRSRSRSRSRDRRRSRERSRRSRSRSRSKKHSRSRRSRSRSRSRRSRSRSRRSSSRSRRRTNRSSSPSDSKRSPPAERPKQEADGNGTVELEGGY